MEQVDHRFLFDRETLDLASDLLALFSQHNLTLGTAESLTGGLVSSAFVSIPGASQAFSAGICTYQPNQKTSLLGVEPEILTRFGAASKECAQAMVLGGVQRLDVDGIICTTGVAGPDKDEWGREVGTVFVGVGFHGETEVVELHIDPNLPRNDMRLAVVREALNLSLDFFKSCVRPLS